MISAATGRITSSNPNLQAVPKHPFPLVLFPENKGIFIDYLKI